MVSVAQILKIYCQTGRRLSQRYGAGRCSGFYHLIGAQEKKTPGNEGGESDVAEIETDEDDCRFDVPVSRIQHHRSLLFTYQFTLESILPRISLSDSSLF